MKKGLMSLLFLVAGLFALSARADVLVLIHGYLGGAYSWDQSGVTAALQQHEWQPAGIYVAGPGGVQLLPAAGMQGKRKIYAVDLPSEAPVLVQSVPAAQLWPSTKFATHAVRTENPSHDQIP